MGTALPRPGRRRFVVGLGASVALLVTGCRGSGPAPGTADDPHDAERLARLPAPPAPPEVDTNRPRYVDDARAWLVGVPAVALPRARALLPPDARGGLEHGLLALSDVCPYDQVQLPFCESAAWFECPACGSQFDALGGRRAGPAPAGMSFHRVHVSGPSGDEDVTVGASPRIRGLPPELHLVDHHAAGPHCA